MQTTTLLQDIQFNQDGLIPAIAQCHHSGQVLMMAWMNKESLEQTISSGRVCYWSRSRSQLWRKGDSSGHIQKLIAMRLDCDKDCLLLTVDQIGAACHTYRRSCFFWEWQGEDWHIISSPLSTQIEKE